jgi:Ca2+-binding RTX toxin-like protein
MKPYINFLIFVLAAIALYTAYGMFAFQEDEPKPFVFNEPKLPVDLILKDEENPNSPAIEMAQKALTYYRDEQKKAPQQANDTVALLVDRMTNSDLPLYFLSAPNAQNGNKRSFETLKISSDSIIDPSLSQNKLTLNCSAKAPMANMIIGTYGKDVIGCDMPRQIQGGTADADVMFIGGPEDDVISDVTGNRIVNGGTGNDTIKLGAGRSIIVLDASWGKDTVSVDCTGATIQPAEIPSGFAIPWVYKTTNFIVLGNSINPKDVEWRGNVLTHKITGDTLTVNQNCFTVVPAL